MPETFPDLGRSPRREMFLRTDQPRFLPFSSEQILCECNFRSGSGFPRTLSIIAISARNDKANLTRTAAHSRLICDASAIVKVGYDRKYAAAQIGGIAKL